MFKKTVTYPDFNGVERTEDYFFNITKTDLSEMQMSQPGGLKGFLERIIAAKNEAEIMAMFKELVVKSYGEKSPDGRYHIKSPAVQEMFTYSPAYDIIYMELATDEIAAAAFIKGIIPPDVAVELEKETTLKVVE